MADEELPIEELIDEKLIFFDVEAKDREDLICQLASRAVEAGYTTEGYAEDVIDRERQFPTALSTQVMKVAVPHAMVQTHVIRPAIVVARLSTPVTFKEMGDGINDVEVECVFMLVAKGDKHHLKVLQKLISMLADPVELERLRNIDSASAMASELLDHLA